MNSALPALTQSSTSARKPSMSFYLLGLTGRRTRCSMGGKVGFDLLVRFRSKNPRQIGWNLAVLEVLDSVERFVATITGGSHNPFSPNCLTAAGGVYSSNSLFGGFFPSGVCVWDIVQLSRGLLFMVSLENILLIYKLAARGPQVSHTSICWSVLI